jgi:hypothetical protein
MRNVEPKDCPEDGNHPAKEASAGEAAGDELRGPIMAGVSPPGRRVVNSLDREGQGACDVAEAGGEHTFCQSKDGAFWSSLTHNVPWSTT